MITCLLAMLLATPLHTQRGPETPSPSAREDVVVIDGHKDPGKIPEWLAWESGFTIIDAWIGRDSGFTHDLRETLAAGEFSSLEREAVAQAERRTEAIREAEQLRPEVKTTDPKDAEAARKLLVRIHAIDLKYRRATLAARDRLLQSLSPGSQAALQAWIAQGKDTIVSRVPRSELAHYRSPE